MDQEHRKTGQAKEDEEGAASGEKGETNRANVLGEEGAADGQGPAAVPQGRGATVSAGVELARFRTGQQTAARNQTRATHSQQGGGWRGEGRGGGQKRDRRREVEKEGRGGGERERERKKERKSESKREGWKQTSRERWISTHSESKVCIQRAHTCTFPERGLGFVPVLRRGASGVCLEGLTASR